METKTKTAKTQGKKRKENQIPMSRESNGELSDNRQAPA